MRVAPPWIRQWWERVAPPELTGGSSRAVVTSDQIGTGAEVWTTSDNNATRETCTENQIWKGRYQLTKEPWIQEPRRKNESQLVSEDMTTNTADSKTKVHTSERLTLMQRQIPPRRGEGDQRRWVCLTLTLIERKHRASHGGPKGEHRMDE